MRTAAQTRFDAGVRFQGVSHATAQENVVFRLAGRTVDLTSRVLRRLLMPALRPLFGSHGKRFHFDPRGFYSYPNIHVGDDVSLGYRPLLLAALSEIRIGNHVMFGPEVVIIAGNHNTTAPGRFMCDVLEKTSNDDLTVTIEDDVWIGARAVILRGVRIGRGSVVGAAAVVTRFVPPYAIVAGNPAKVIRFRWDVDTVLRHEEALYRPQERYTREQLETWQAAEAMPTSVRKERPS